jgi:hypothetical protein
MDLRVYYQKIRKLEAEILDPFVVLISRETPDGGKAGVKTDVPRGLAARLIVEERAEMASPEEAELFRAERERDWRAAEEAEDRFAERFHQPAPMRMPRRAAKPVKQP